MIGGSLNFALVQHKAFVVKTAERHCFDPWKVIAARQNLLNRNACGTVLGKAVDPG